MITRLLCSLLGHRWQTDREDWGGAVVTVCRCPRCGRLVAALDPLPEQGP